MAVHRKAKRATTDSRITIRTIKSAQKKDLPKDVANWLDRRQVADLLGVCINTIVAMETRDVLHPVRILREDGRGIARPTYVYDPNEVARVPRMQRVRIQHTPGEIAARCFELFDEGRTTRDIVILLREEPDKIEAMREKWLDAGGADRVLSNEAWKELEKLLGPFGSIAELVERAATKLKGTSVAA